ncbi:MAG: DUF4149 domain-containing protein [Planctomycetota bacterium]
MDWKRYAYIPVGMWLGAMVCTIYVAPRVFRMLGEDQRELAGNVMAGVFLAVDCFGFVAMLIALGASLCSKPRWILSALLGVGAAFSAFYVNPKIVARENIDFWHGLSTKLWMAMLIGALILAVLGSPRAKSPAA